MKKILSLAMSAAMIFGLASCSKDETLSAGGADAGNETLAFTIKSPQTSLVTYAIANDDEMKINTVDAYAFGEDGTLITLAATDYEKTTNGNNTTIKVKTEWLAQHVGETVSFYFVANDNGHVNAALTNVTAFTNQVTKPLHVDGSSMIDELISTPLLFSATTDVLIQGRKEPEVKLKRREARFDIRNDYAKNVAVNAIKVSKANTEGYLFADGTGHSFTKNSIKSGLIAVPVYAAENPTGVFGSYVKTVVNSKDVYTAASVFYLYPTVLGVDADQTEISIEATVGTQTDTYVAAENVKGMEIKANTRYTIVLDPLSLTFTVVPADYVDGGEIGTVPGGDDAFSTYNVNDAAATGTIASGVYTFGAADTGDIVIDVVSKYGTASKSVFVMGAETDVPTYKVVQATPVVSYSGHTVTDKYTVTVPKSDATKALSIRLEIYSPNGKAKETILFTNGAAVSADDVKEAVGGNEALGNAIIESIVTEKNKPADQITAEDIENTTKIDVSGAGSNGNVSSLEGIENLPNLKEISASYNENLTGSIDLSGNPELTYVDLGGTSITEVNLSGNPKLTIFDAGYTDVTNIDFSGNPELIQVGLRSSKITEVDFSKNPNLEIINLSETNITKLDLSNNTNLKRVELSRTALKELDVANNTKMEQISVHMSPDFVDLKNLGNCTELKHLYIAGTKISSIDISKNTKMVTFSAYSMVSESLNVNVWSGFNTTNPSQSISSWGVGSTTITFSGQ